MKYFHLKINTLPTKLKSFIKSTPYIMFKDALTLIPYNPLKIEVLNTLQLDINNHKKFNFNRNVSIYELNKSNIVAKCKDFKNKCKISKQRLAKGEICLLATMNNRVIGYEWYSTLSRHIDERRMFSIGIPHDSIYSYDAFVIPELRGKKIFPSIIHTAIELCRKKHKRYIISLVEHQNHASLNTHLKLGFKIIERKIYINLFAKMYSIKLSLQTSK